MARKTVQQLLSNASKEIDLLDAELLLAHVLHTSREFVLSLPEFQVSGFTFQRYRFRRLVKKRKKGIPLAYLTGHKEFFGLDFLVNKDTLIPRPDTEVLVEEAIKEIEKTKQEVTLVDIGTGSGCIPIAIVKKLNNRPHIRTYGTDSSKKALQIAKKNAKPHSGRIHFLHGNLLEPVRSLFTDHDPLGHHPKSGCSLIITANLPYLTEEQFESETSIQAEPKSALVAKDNGLALYTELLKQIKELVSGFKLHVSCFFEIDPSQTESMHSLIETHLPNTSIEVVQDLAGHDRVVCARLSSVTNSNLLRYP